MPQDHFSILGLRPQQVTVRPAGRRAAAIPPPDDWTRRQQLAQKVRRATEGGLLRWSARQALLAEAERMGLNRFVAMLTIAETLHLESQRPRRSSQPIPFARIMERQIERRRRGRGVAGWICVGLVLTTLAADAFLIWLLCV